MAPWTTAISEPANGHPAHGFSVADILSGAATSWDKRISVDLIAEMEVHLSEKVTTLPQMRRILAVKGYRELKRRIESDVKGKEGFDALRSMARAMRNFALERPGLSAAAFRSPTTDSEEWRQAGTELAQTVRQVFAHVGVEGEAAERALRLLRSLVRGFVINEVTGSFFIEPEGYKETFDLGIEQFILGLPALNGSVNLRADC